jgi:Holliday junction DNA helicase RuvA
VPTDRDIFELLVSVKGIAGKSAMAILDTLSPRDIFTAIKDDNYEIFSTAQGIGKKTAQRIVFELKPKLQIIASLLAQSDTEPDSRVTIYSDALLELQETLLSLGYSRAETVHTLQRTLPRYAEGQEEDFLRVCLEELAK